MKSQAPRRLLLTGKSWKASVEPDLEVAWLTSLLSNGIILTVQEAQWGGHGHRTPPHPCNSQKILLWGSSIQCSKWLSKNYHLAPRFSLFQKRRRRKQLSDKPAQRLQAEQGKHENVVSGLPRGRREPLFTLASILNTSHGQVYWETDLLTE